MLTLSRRKKYRTKGSGGNWEGNREGGKWDKDGEGRDVETESGREWEKSSPYTAGG